ncbi:MAG: PAS domain S-box protein [Candidatus Brocadiae bacterium]|nr:PAS domain S-box protein [Candidatus Brocadiia bacterium]
MQLYLIVEKGIRYGESFTITNFPAVFGRGDQSNVQFKDIGVSRSHFVIDFVEDNFVIQDLGSTNGTRLNDEKILEATMLKHDDVIVVGKVLLLRVSIDYSAPSQNISKSNGLSNIEKNFIDGFSMGMTPVSGTLSDLQIRLYEKSIVKRRQLRQEQNLSENETEDNKVKQEILSEKKNTQKTPQLPLLKFLKEKKINQSKKEDSYSPPPSYGNPKSKFSEEQEGILSEDFEKIHIDVTQTSILTPQAELYHSYRALKTIYEVVQNCNNETNTERLLQSLLTSVCKTVNADRGAVVLKKENNVYELKAFVGEDRQKSRLPVSRTVLAEVMERGLSIISKSPSDDEKYRYSESIRIHRLKAIICSPLISRNKIFGAIYLDRSKANQEFFRHQDLELLSAIGIHIGATLEKSLLLEEVTKVNSYLEAVIESVPVGIHTLGLDGIFNSWSSYSENIFGFSEEETLGRMPIWQLFYDKEAGQRVFDSVGTTEVFFDEIKMQKKDGSIFPCRFALSPILDQSGKLLGYTGYHQDITKENQQREQLFSQEKLAALGMLAAGVAHDFNNIFSLILGYTNMAMGDAPDSLKGYLTKVVTHVGRAGEIAGNLLRYSRHENVQLTEENPLVLLQEVLTLVQKELYASDIKVITEFKPLVTQKLIPGQVQEVFLNIILNARDAMSGGGIITIKTFFEDGNNKILFEDTGEGIAPENLKRIFEPFFSTKKKKANKAGTGLGLSISYQIMQKHGGSILVESVLHKGTQFQLVFPIEIKENQ